MGNCCTSKPQKSKYNGGPAPKYMTDEKAEQLTRKSIQQAQQQQKPQQQQQQSQQQQQQQSNNGASASINKPVSAQKENKRYENQQVIEESQKVVNTQNQPTEISNRNNGAAAGNPAALAHEEDIQVVIDPQNKNNQQQQEKQNTNNNNLNMESKQAEAASAPQNSQYNKKSQLLKSQQVDYDECNMEEQNVDESKHIDGYMKSKEATDMNDLEQLNNRFSKLAENDPNQYIFDYHMKAILKTINMDETFHQNIQVSIPEKQSSHYYVETMAYCGQVNQNNPYMQSQIPYN